MKIVSFGASTSSASINKKLAIHTAEKISDADVTILDLNDYEMPIYSEDRQREDGIPEAAHRFRKHLSDADGVIVSFAEHNGAYTAAFKNIMDWNSVIEGKPWLNKTFFLMGTSPGGRGASTILDIALAKWPFMGASIVASFSLPSFGDHFNEEKGITDDDLREAHSKELEKFVTAVTSTLAT